MRTLSMRFVLLIFSLLLFAHSLRAEGEIAGSEVPRTGDEVEEGEVAPASQPEKSESPSSAPASQATSEPAAGTQPAATQPAATQPAAKAPSAPVEVEKPTNVQRDKPPVVDDVLRLRVDAALSRKLRLCHAKNKRGDDRAIIDTCLKAIEEKSGTEAGYKAGAIRAFLNAPTKEKSDGRFELTAVSGLYGAWVGVATSTSILSFAQGGDPALGILIVGGASIASAIGLGVGGYFLAKNLKLKAGASRLTASGLVWGSSLGIAAVLPVLDVISDSRAAYAASVMTVVAGGAIGGVIGFTVAKIRPTSIEQVSLVNTGGWIGGVSGLAMALSSAAEFGDGVFLPTITFMGIQSAGLALGYGVGTVTDFSWGQTLLIDLGGALGFVVAGTVLLASGGISPIVNSVLLSGATIGGAAATGAWLATSNLAKGTTRKGAQSYQITPLMLQDKNASLAMGFALRGVTF